jgi:hypothetical protein
VADQSVQAHTQEVTLHLLEFFPSHEPRTGDPHYHLFNAARKKLKEAGKLVCWVCGKDEAAAGQPIELHHSRVEYALQNGVDLQRFKDHFPDLDITDEESFFAFVEGPENLTPLCKLHHTGQQGIHSLPSPCWNALAYWKSDLPAPGQVIPANKND